ncbi:hypothetical protein DXF96_12345 [Heyndrickxia coagulans]|nr:hypothetical protein CYJ15_06830 [Heyndrickxia coagulans]QDI62206.1 hypothetical protein DXF96_12345 [Heyndrickxia coagulans]
MFFRDFNLGGCAPFFRPHLPLAALKFAGQNRVGSAGSPELEPFYQKRMDESFALESAATDENKQQRMVHFFVFSKLFL